MLSKFNRRTFLALFFLCTSLTIAISPLMGQSEIIITITAPGWVSHIFSDELFAPFEVQHPGVKVVAVPVGDAYYYPAAAEDIQQHLDGAQTYVSLADVVYVDKNIASVESTRAGYFLNLDPYVSSDPTANTDDFFPAIWQSGQWDGGTWYIPASAYVDMLAYNIAAFDEARLVYPSENWTFDDFANAVRELTIYDADGNVTVPGFQLYNPALFYYGVTRQPFYDTSANPSIPQFDRPDVVAFYEQWKSLMEETTPTGDFDYTQIPFTFDAPWRFSNRGSDMATTWGVSPLPGGVTSLSIEGFAVSGGTLNPEMAYALANFMSSDPLVMEAFSGDTPARRSLLAADSTKDAAAIEQALDIAVPLSELRFEDYLEAVLYQETEDGESFDMQAAIQEAERNAVTALEAADARRDSAIIAIATPVPTPSMSEGQIVLHFGLGMDMTANQSEWTQIVSDFLAANPAVGNVEFDDDFFDPADQAKLDCLYLPYNQVPFMPLENYLSLDPLIDADPTFDRADFIGTSLDQLQRDNRIWAYPIMLQPAVLWYDSALFDQAGLPSPEQGWTVDEFENALRTLKGSLENDTDPVFESGTYGNNYLLMLMAAYGGIPYDYRTTPPTVNFTDPTSVEAIRQVLDLAKEGYLGYPGFTGNNVITLGEPSTTPITDDVFSDFSGMLYNRINGQTEDSFRLANYPQGSQYTPVAFGIGAGYIQANAQNPEACYNFILNLAERPDLFGGMPARASQVNDPTLNLAQGEDITTLYQTFMDIFQQPNTVSFPSPFGGSDGNLGEYLEPLWLNRVFDSYVLEEGDLETELAEAQTFIEGYRACASEIAPVTPDQLITNEDANAYYRQFADCAISIDPSMQEELSYLY
jgi:ABC-type glycerol-3-phosphate transport system substrate-binding protein